MILALHILCVSVRYLYRDLGSEKEKMEKFGLKRGIYLWNFGLV